MFSGNMTALVTPFQDGKVDFEALGRLIEFQLENGVNGLVPCGTTGESATLSETEHREVIEFTIRTVAKRVPVLAGTGSNDTATAIALTRHAAQAGADGALLITPYYNKPTQEGLYRHYAEVARSTGLPLVLYNVPGRTAVNMLPETVARLTSEFSHIIGLKDATGSLTQAGETLQLVDRADFVLLSGDDGLVLPLLAIGAVGVISVLSNVAPASMSELIAAFRSGNSERARQVHYRQLPLSKSLFVETSPAPIKAALEMTGMMGGELRLPMVPVKESTRELLKRDLAKVGVSVKGA